MLLNNASVLRFLSCYIYLKANITFVLTCFASWRAHFSLFLAEGAFEPQKCDN